MEPLPIPKGTSTDLETFFRNIFAGAQGSLIELPSAPTGDALKPSQVGFFGTDIYFNTPSGTKIKLTGSSWS